MAAILIATLAPPAAAQSGRQSDADEPPRDKVVCKARAETGTRFRTKTCHTVAQWEIIAEENRRGFEEMQGPTISTERGN